MPVVLIMEGGQPGALLHLPAMLPAMFGAFGAATVTTSLKALANPPRLPEIVFKCPGMKGKF